MLRNVKVKYLYCNKLAPISALKKILITVSLFLCFVSSFGQQDPLYSQYMFNPVVINPAYSGLYDMSSLTAGFRTQWAGFEGAPTTMSANFHTTLPIDNMGTGITFVRDSYGANTNTDVNLAVSYNIKTGYYSRFSMGIQGGFYSNSFDRDALTYQDDNDPLFSYDQVTSPNFGFGILYNSKKFWVGASVPKLLEISTTSNINDTTISIYSPHYYFTGGAIIRLRDDLKLKPSTLVKIIDGAPASVDINASLLYRNSVWAGLSFRNLNSLAVLAQFIFQDKIRAGVAYEFPLATGLRKSNNAFATFEIMANVNLSIFDVQAVQLMYY